MSYSVKLYKNTGFDAVNIPGNARILSQFQSVNCPALDIYQARELNSFTVRARYYNIYDADYLYLINDDDPHEFAYYSIQSITMTSMDVAVLSVTMDYILTAVGTYGVENLVITDGMCERHHVAVADDTFGAYDEDDPYMTPSEMMRIDTPLKPNFAGSSSTDDVTIMESTIDLRATYYDATTGLPSQKGVDYESTDGNVVTVPSVTGATDSSKASMEDGSSGSGAVNTWLPNVIFYLVSRGTSFPTFPSAIDISWISPAIAAVRSLGIESCILAQYNVPAFMVENSVPQQVNSHGEFAELRGTRKVVACSSLPFLTSYTHTVRNKRIYYGENVKYHIISVASGNEAEFLPEEIYNYDSPINYPSIEMRVDPRPKGSPYFRFQYYRGINSSEDMFFVNAVKGLEWQNAPLTFQGASGSLLNQYNFNAKMAAGYEAANYGYKAGELQNQQSNMNATANMAGSVLSGIGYGLSGSVGGMFGAAADAATAAMNQNYVNANFALARQHQEKSWAIQKNTELQSLLIQNNVVAPTVKFPISEAIRDFVGNTCLVYRTKYTENDVARIDKILNMFGYKHTTPLTTDLLTNRSKFNYIQAKGVAIKGLVDNSNGDIPKWIREGVAAQLSNGVRIWHVPVDTRYYVSGNT